MSQNPWVAILKGGVAMTGALILILYGLSAYFYRDIDNMLEYFFGTVFFAGIYMLILSALLQMLVHWNEPDRKVHRDMIYLRPYLKKGKREYGPDNYVGQYEKGMNDPALVFYGYFTGVLCFFIGMFGVAALID